MNRLFLLLFGMVTFLAHAQVPDYVPTEGLVGWYPLESDANDYGPNTLHGTAHDVSFEIIDGRSSGHFNGVGKIDLSDFNEELCIQEGYSIAYSFYSTSSDGERPIFTRTRWNDNTTEYFFGLYDGSVAVALNNSGCGLACNWADVELVNVSDTTWNYLTLTWQVDTLKVYLNGNCISNAVITLGNEAVMLCNSDQAVYIGYNPVWNTYWQGAISGLGLWNRILTDGEVVALYNAQLPAEGCTDPTACNFDAEATSDDGSCIPSGCMELLACNYNALAECEGEACDYACCPGPGCCLDGTTWDAELGGCVPDETNVATANSCPHDIDFDGLIGVVDLMDLLSVFGTDCPEADDTGDDPETAEFTCGDPVSYQGYDYATVQIGEQCWFAENLRHLPEVSPASDHSLSEPRGYVYGYNGSNVVEAKLTLNYETFGALYNFQAITQWALCPVGWHVPSDDDWKDLELVLGVPSDSLDAVGYRGTDAGVKLKSDVLWNGSNQSGMNMLPAGGTLDSGEFAFLNERGWFWTNTTAPQEAAWFRQLESNQNGIYRAHWNQNQEGGHSIRCLKDQ